MPAVHGFPRKLPEKIQDFVVYYDPECYHEYLGHITYDDVYYGKMAEVPKRRRLLKRQPLVRQRAINLRKKPSLEPNYHADVCQMI